MYIRLLFYSRRFKNNSEHR